MADSSQRFAAAFRFSVTTDSALRYESVVRAIRDDSALFLAGLGTPIRDSGTTFHDSIVFDALPKGDYTLRYFVALLGTREGRPNTALDTVVTPQFTGPRRFDVYRLK